VPSPGAPPPDVTNRNPSFSPQQKEPPLAKRSTTSTSKSAAKAPAILGTIIQEAKTVHSRIDKGEKPQMKLPIRSLSNVSYRPKVGHFQLQGKNKVRALTVNTVKTFAQTLKMLAMSKDLVETERHSTKREAYYQAYNWGEAAFADQTESDTVMDDVEAMLGVNREQMHFRADEHGGEVAGELIVIDKDRRTKQPIEIDCTHFGSGA
jgi:DNA topoisomerase-6 subunit A